MRERPGGPPPPRANPELVGHGEAERLLVEAFRGGRLAHAWLIAGPRGVGKATLAFRFARFLLAGGGTRSPGEELFAPPAAVARPASLYVDPQDPVFRRIAAGGHADLLTVERGYAENGSRRRSEIVVVDARAIGAFLNLTPAEGGWRVVVVDSADEMNRNAANAVLKILEEPPSRSLLLLVSHNPGSLLATIRSRCRLLVLKPLAEADVVALLAEHCPAVAAADARALARLAEGSIGRALALAEEGGLELYRDLVGLLAGLPRLEVAALHALGERLARPGAEDAFRTAGELLRWWLGRLVVSGAAGEAKAADGLAAAEERALMARLAAAGGLERWLEVWEKINRLLAPTGAAGLERKQAVVNAFLAIEGAARP